jgi:hypothetical protein
VIVAFFDESVPTIADLIFGYLGNSLRIALKLFPFSCGDADAGIITIEDEIVLIGLIHSLKIICKKLFFACSKHCITTQKTALSL